jgi:hypothetical protein
LDRRRRKKQREMRKDYAYSLLFLTYVRVTFLPEHLFSLDESRVSSSPFLFLSNSNQEKLKHYFKNIGLNLENFITVCFPPTIYTFKSHLSFKKNLI